MKLLLLIPALCMGLCNPVQSQTVPMELTPPMVVSGGTQYGSVKPRIALLHDTLPVVCWTTHSPNGKIFFSKWNGTGFSAPVEVTPPGFDLAYAGPSDGPAMAVKGDTVFISFFYFWNGISKIYLIRSIDGGNTFGDTVRVDHQFSTGYDPYSPYVSIQNDGNPYIAFEMSANGSTNPQQMFCKSNDGGFTFPNEITSNTPAPGKPCECCPPFLLLNDSMVYLLYRNNISNIRDIYCAVSANYGASFDTVVRIDFTNYYINGCPSQGPEAIFSGDSIVAVWTGKPMGSYARIYAGNFHAGTFETGINIMIDSLVTGNVVQWNPVISGSTDTFGIAWEDARTGEKACYMSVSTKGLYGFDSVIMISDSSVSEAQLTPSLAYKSGIFHIVYRNEMENQVIYRKLNLAKETKVEELIKNNSGISIFPNPVDGSEIYLSGLPDRKWDLKIFNSFGEQLIGVKIKEQQNKINVNTLFPGLYFLLLMNEEQIISGKFIKTGTQ